MKEILRIVKKLAKRHLLLRIWTPIFMKNLKGHVYQIVMKNFQYTEDRRYLKIFIIAFQKKKYLSFPFLTSNIRILLMLNSRLFVKFWLNYKDVYSRYKYYVGCTKQKFHINLKDDAFFKPQRVTKVPIHYREQVNALLERLIQVGIIREINDDDELGTFLDNPIIYLRKEKNLKLCVDSRFLTSITKLFSIPFAIEPIHILLTRLTGKVFSVCDLSNAYHQVPLTEGSQKCTAFVIGNKQYTYCRGFYGLSGLANFFSRLMALSMAPLIKTNQALTYIDDTILQAQNKAEIMMYTLEINLTTFFIEQIWIFMPLKTNWYKFNVNLNVLKCLQFWQWL